MTRTALLSKRLISAFLLLSSLALTPIAHADAVSDVFQNEQISVRLLADHSSISPGQTFQLGLQLLPNEGWHTYWKNPGDSGLPTRISWDLPAGVTAGDIQWPTPHAAAIGDIMNYGYEHPEMLLVPFSLANNFSAEQVTISATANWLVCADTCIPQQATFAITLAVKPQAIKANNREFARAKAALPINIAVSGSFTYDDSHLKLQLKHPSGSFSDWQQLRLFSAETDLINHAAAQAFLLNGKQLYASILLNDYFAAPASNSHWVLTGLDPNGQPQALSFALPKTDLGFWPTTEKLATFSLIQAPSAIELSSATGEGFGNANTADEASLQLWLAILLAMMGGLILNLMPCVLPVLSLKLLAIAKAQGQALRAQRHHALAYGAGVVLSFLVVAGLLLGLRAAGSQIGWGFQLQTPWFVAALAYLMIALGLSMSGMVMFGQRFMGAGQELTAKEGSTGSFFTGVLAVVVASPCSAPFMGSALGWAISQPPLSSLLVFTGLGIGMAMPMVLVAWWPWFARLLPKPGLWMERLKQALAFPLYLTAVWLLWVLGQQVSQDAVALVSAGAVMLALSLWIFGLRQRGEGGIKSTLVAIIALAISLAALTQLQPRAHTTLPISTEQQAYSHNKLQVLLDNHTPVFIDMTAAWCITCQVNERVALQQAEVQQAFAENGVVQMIGDWTNRDPEITAFLAEFGRNGVPLYVLFDSAGEATVLPQVLSSSLVLNAIGALERSR